MKNDREFEFRLSPNEMVSITVTSLADWIASIQSLTNVTYPNADSAGNDPRCRLFEAIASKIRVVIPQISAALQSYQMAEATGPSLNSTFNRKLMAVSF
jgi:hypothetical protein